MLSSRIREGADCIRGRNFGGEAKEVKGLLETRVCRQSLFQSLPLLKYNFCSIASVIITTFGRVPRNHAG